MTPQNHSTGFSLPALLKAAEQWRPDNPADRQTDAQTPLTGWDVYDAFPFKSKVVFLRQIAAFQAGAAEPLTRRWSGWAIFYPGMARTGSGVSSTAYRKAMEYLCGLRIIHPVLRGGRTQWHWHAADSIQRWLERAETGRPT